MTDTKTKPKTTETASPVIAAIRTDVTIPEKRASNRGSKSIYNLDDLPVAGSIGVVNKTASQLRQIVSNANRKHRTEKRDDNGAVVYKTKPLSGPDGVTNVPTNEPEMIATRKYMVVDTDPKTDPDKASARIFREL